MEKSKTKKIDYLATLVYNEYDQAKQNKSSSNADFEDALDMLDGIRSQKNYEWQSDINIPAYPSIILTECSMWGNQYFPTRDFVNCFLEGNTPEDKVRSDIAKNVINKTLNLKELHHFHKYIRARLINGLSSQVLLLCSWEKEIIQRKTGDNQVSRYNEETKMAETINEPIMETQVIKDMWNYEPIDPRNWFCSNEYSYSIQDKEWVTIRSETSFSDTRMNANKLGYINTDKLKDFFKSADGETSTSKETYNQSLGINPGETKINEIKNWKCDKLTRFGKLWVEVKEKDEWGYPLKVDSGFDDNGEPRDNAEYIECVIEELIMGGKQLIIRLVPQWCHTRQNIAYRPLIRGLNYIHPVKDVGMNDAKYLKDVQIGLNDTINMSNDRVSMATFPTIIANEYAVQDNSSLFWEPEHIMTVPDINQIREFKISTDVGAALNQASLFANWMYQLPGVYPQTGMGGLPSPSTTATASSNAQASTNMRANYKSMTVEHTLLNPMYWMILNMTYQFAELETIKKMVGEDIMDWFDPDADYTYQPISSNIELEYNKKNLVNQATQLLGLVMKIPNPKMAVIANQLLVIALENMGKEFSQIKDMLLDESAPVQPVAGAGGSAPGNPGMEGMSNQNNMPMSPMEIQTREGVNQ